MALVLGCSERPRYVVTDVRVADSEALTQFAGAGLDRDALRDCASRSLAATPGFGPVSRAARSTEQYTASVKVQRVEALGGAAAKLDVVQVGVTIELEPTKEGSSGHRGVGRAAEPASRGTAELRAAVGRAANAAIERAIAELALGLAAERKSVRELVADLSSSEARIRDHAIRALAQRGERSAISALIDRLRDPNPEVAERAVGALAQLGDPSAVPAIIRLAHGRDGEYVANLARVVGDLGGVDAEAWLLTMASGHPEEVVRDAAREALTQMAARAPSSRGEEARWSR